VHQTLPVSGTDSTVIRPFCLGEPPCGYIPDEDGPAGENVPVLGLGLGYSAVQCGTVRHTSP